ncbi:MAG: 50S ribosomal protein L28 [Deltaproteobacteria bacterium]|jgi:large subunit ribosomal protein L28|nr:50S ribosomal protein L28 [Deltaproteobacteria bacterium]
MQRCDICNKGSNIAKKHSLRGSQVTKRTAYVQKPNLKKVKIMIGSKSTKINVCTRCIRSGYLNND